MAVVFMDGFDMYNGVQAAIGLQSRWITSQTGQYTTTTTTPFTNGQALRVIGDVQFNIGYFSRVLPSTVSTSCVGFHFYTTSVSGMSTRSSSAVVYFRNAGAFQFGIQLLSTGILVVNTYSAAGTITAEMFRTTVPIAAATWYHMGLVFTMGTAGTGSIELFIDGASAGSATGVTTARSGVALVDEIYFYNSALSGGSNYFDDLYVTDAATFLGIRRIETLRPTSDTAQKQWTALSGTDNYAMVDESVVDGDTTYVETSTVGNQDLYDIANLSSTPGTIDAVQIVSFPRRTDATARTQYNSLKSGATNSDGTAFALSATYSHYPRLLNLNPDGSVAWTGAAVDALQIGPKLAS